MAGPDHARLSAGLFRRGLPLCSEPASRPPRWLLRRRTFRNASTPQAPLRTAGSWRASTVITELEFKRLADEGHNRIPLLAEAFADLETPLSLYLKLASG